MITVVQSADANVAPSDVAAIISATELVDIRASEINAGPVGNQSDDQPMFTEVEHGQPGFAVSDDGELLIVRLEHIVTVSSEGSEAAHDEGEKTVFKFVHLIGFQSTADISTTPAAISAFIETNAYFIAYPYVRHLVTTLSSQLGLPPVTLGFLKREEWQFSTNDEV